MTWFCSADGFRLTLCLLCLFALNGSVKPRPLPEDGGTVTQTGEPSHFQVDDKAAEIEVNANPAGVKVNAKPASLQVVAKPGAPAVPIFHPAIHLAQHYAPPPVIHHNPALFYHGGYHFPFGHDWFYNGIKRQKLPKPQNDGIDARTHKSDIPHLKHRKKISKSHKRQFISAVPQFAQPSPLAPLRGLSAYGAYGYGVLPQYGPLVGAALGGYGLRQNPQAGLLASPSQPTPQQILQESGVSRSLLPSESNSGDADPTDILRRYQKLYGELNTLASLYNSIVKQRNLHSLQDLGYGGALGVAGAPRMNTAGTDLGFGLPTQYGGAMMGYGRTYIPSPLAQLYGRQTSPPQTNRLLDVTGASLVGQQPLARYLDLSSLMQSSPTVVSRSKVPTAPDKKVKNDDHQDHLDEKKKVKRQALVEPILAAEDPSSVDDLLQDDVDQDYKRRMILTPALETLQQLQPVQPLFTQQALQPQSLQLRPLQLQQQMLPEQPLARQTLGLQGMAIQPTGIQQPVSLAGNQQLGGFLPLTSTPLRYMTSSLVTPVEPMGSTLAGRSPSPVSPLTQSFASPSLMSPLISNAFSRPRNDFGPLQSLSSSGLLQDRSHFRDPLRLGYPSFSRRLQFHRPQYRRRLHNFREEDDLDGIQPEVIGRERITQEGSYSTEDVPNSGGETLINSPVGFGPITVEAKTAEGARAAEAAGEDKRHRIHKPAEKKHKKDRRQLKTHLRRLRNLLQIRT